MDINQKIVTIFQIINIIHRQLGQNRDKYFINFQKHSARQDLEPKKEIVMNNSIDLEIRLQTIIEIADILYYQAGYNKIKLNHIYHNAYNVYNNCKKEYMESTNINERLQKLLVVILVPHHLGLSQGFSRYKETLDSPYKHSNRVIQQLVNEGGFTYPW